MFTRHNLLKRCTPSVEAVICEFLNTVPCGSSVVGSNPTVFSLRTSILIWHPNVGFVAMISGMDSNAWAIMSFMERVLLLIMCVFARLQLHQLPEDKYTPTANSELNAATEHLARCVTGTIIF